jgi:hypothetical protein
MFTRTFASLADEARALTEREGDPALGDDVLAPWINQEIRKVWAMAARMGPDEFTKTSSMFTIAAGNTFTIATVGGADAATDFMHLRGVDITGDAGAHWRRIKPWKFLNRDLVGSLKYRLRGRTLEILPSDLARTYPYRLWYVFAPPEMLGAGSDMAAVDKIDLPLGADDYVAQGVAARIRTRFEDDPIIHYAAQKAALETMQRWFTMNRQGEAEAPRGADDADYDDDGWW